MEWYHWEGCSRQRAIDKALIELHEEEINLSLGQTQLRAAIGIWEEGGQVLCSAGLRLQRVSHLCGIPGERS